jgi:hypothetical protein
LTFSDDELQGSGRKLDAVVSTLPSKEGRHVRGLARVKSVKHINRQYPRHLMIDALTFDNRDIRKVANIERLREDSDLP